MKIKSKKKAFMLIDAAIGVMLMAIIAGIYYSAIMTYMKHINKIDGTFYSNIALTECAEVVHSVRYGEIDKMGSGGWTSFQSKYPTGVYKLNYDEANKKWDILPIYKNTTTQERYISFREMLEDKGYSTPETEGEIFYSGSNSNKKIKLRRFLFINNDIADKSKVKCYIRAYDPTLIKHYFKDKYDINNYEMLDFTMTDYL